MKKRLMLVMAALLMASHSAHAINARYRQLLERSGCTQMSEMQGCDIHKSKAENAKAGFVKKVPAEGVDPAASANASPYAGTWTAVGPDGGTVAEIQIDARNRVKVNGKSVKARRGDGGLTFKQGFITYFIQGDRRLKGEDYWVDSDAKTRGPINAR
ncbi:MAG: hypothetical protein KDF54_11540 [Hydrogenophaga sp.]|nr:hypothetical protein [Hydrogenophaga sp.]